MKLITHSYLLVVSFVLCVILSCNKNNDLPAVQSNPAHLAFINILPNAVPLNFYINGIRQTTNRIGYLESSGYLNVISGAQTISFEDTTINRKLYFTGSINLRPDTSYSIFLTGQPTNISTIQAIDTAIVDVSNSKAKVRFINGSADAPAFNVYLKDVLYSTFSNQTYKSISAFDRADTGRISIKIKNAVTNVVILSDSITIQPRGVYTLFSYSSYTNNNATGFGVLTIVNH